MHGTMSGRIYQLIKPCNFWIEKSEAILIFFFSFWLSYINFFYVNVYYYSNKKNSFQRMVPSKS